MSHRPFIVKNFPDTDTLSAVAFHPSKKQFVVGLFSGTIECYEYKTPKELKYSYAKKEGKSPGLELLWSNSKHKGSIRSLVYDFEGDYIFGTSNDLTIRKLSSQTGKSVLRLNLSGSDVGAPVKSLMSESFLFVGTEKGTIIALDPGSLKIQETAESISEDEVTAIIDLEALGESKYKVLAAGGSFAYRLDLRKDEALDTSDDQEDDILCGCSVSKERSIFGMSEGIVTVWFNDSLEDQITRIKISKDDSVDAVIAGELEDTAYVASADGIVRLIDAKASKVIDKWIHAKDDEVYYLDLDFEYRLVSGNLETLKIWLNEDDEDETRKRKRAIEEEKTTEAQGQQSDDEETNLEKPKEKKSKSKKNKAKKSKTKQKASEHGISAFSGL